VLNFCVALTGDDETTRDKIAIAVAFHDLGIWTAGTFDYLPPSRQLACAYLTTHGLDAWISEIETMIEQHHKIAPYRGEHARLTEAFRKADLADVSLGLLAGGLPGAFVADVRRAFANAGFHRFLAVQFGRRLRTHPFNPAPMVHF